MKGSDIGRLNDLRRLYDRLVDKLANINDPKKKEAKAFKLMDKLIGPEWRSEVKSKPEFEVFQIEMIADGPKVKDPAEFYDRVRKALLDNGLDSQDYGELPPPKPKESVEEKPLVEVAIELESGSEEKCDCYDCTPCDCPKCNPCNCLMCRMDRIEQFIRH